MINLKELREIGEKATGEVKGEDQNSLDAQDIELVSEFYNEATANWTALLDALEVLKQFAEDIAKGPYVDSDLESLHETYQKRARYLISKFKGADNELD